jgi:hypothetical protein
MVHVQLTRDGADAPFLDVIIAQNLRLKLKRDGHVLSSCLIAGSTGAGTRCGHGVGSGSRTSGSAKNRGYDLGIAWHCHTATP